MSFSDNVFLPGTAMQIGPGGHDDAAILRGLQECCTDLGLDPAKLQPKDINRLIATTGRKFIDASRHADCLRLSAAAPPHLRDKPPLAMQRIFSLRALDDFAAVIHEVDRLFALPDPEERLDVLLSGFVVKWGLSWLIAPCQRLTTRLVPAFSDDPQSFLADDWPGDRHEIIANPTLVSRYEGLTTRAPSPRNRQRAALGSQLFAKMNVLQRGYTLLGSKKIAGSPGQLDEFAKLSERVLAELVELDLKPLIEAAGTGRNILLLRTHSSIVPRELDLKILGVPLVQIGRGTILRPGWQSLQTRSAESNAFKFLKLAKSLRKSQHLVQVFPDGPDGSDFLQLPFRGHQLRIALGPTLLAAQRESQFFFLRSQIRRDRIRAAFIPGPCVGPDTPKDLLDQAYTHFYMSEVEAILDGDPVELGAFAMLESILPWDA